MQYCHPYLRTSVRTATPVDEVYYKTCLEQYGGGAYDSNGRSLHCRTHDLQLKDSDRRVKSADSVCHSCPVGTILYCTEHPQYNYTSDGDNSKGGGINDAQAGPNYAEEYHPVPEQNETEQCRERPCCVKNTSWTEPRICRCSHPDSNNASACHECECGAVLQEPQHQKPNVKHVRFSDEVKVHDDDCEKIFRSLNEDEIKQLCPCCKECAVKGKDECVGRPVLVYELPEPKFEDTSVTQKDFSWKKTPRKEIPPWHPNIKDRWYHLKVPSLVETTYQSDFKPPVVSIPDREPVYLAPMKEKEIDPCQKLSEDFSTWKKTSSGDKHTYHSSCDSCDKDLHRVHLHECDASHLPPQYQCHGDGHICQPKGHAVGEQFTLCEKGDTEGSKYWWQRTCCESKPADCQNSPDLPSNLMKSACPSYMTCYKHDFRNPKKLQSERSNSGSCKACEYCTKPYYEGQPNLLCTKDTRQPFVSQRGGII